MESMQIEMVSELEKGGSTMVFRIAKQTARKNRNIIGLYTCIEGSDGNV